MGKQQPWTLQSWAQQLQEGASRLQERGGGGRRAHPLALAGLLLAGAGFLGIAAYLVALVPPFVQFCSLVMMLGLVCMYEYCSITDELFGTCLAAVIVHCVRGYKSVCGHIIVLLAIPDLHTHDVRMILNGLMNPEPEEPEEAAAEPQPAAAAAPNGVVANGRGTNGHGLNGLAPPPALPAPRPAVGDGFAAAVMWLKRRQLSIGLREQLQLFGLLAQARRGGRPLAAIPDAPPAPERWLEDVKLDARRAFATLSRPAARVQLVRRLAKVDPLFVAAHPELAIPPQAGLQGVVLGLFERRWPARSAEKLAALHRNALRISALVTLSATLKTLNRLANKESLRRILRTGVASGIGWAVSLYLLALVRGVPVQVHLLGARLFAWLRGRRFSIENSGPEAATPNRLVQYLAMLLVPRMRQSLFADEAQGTGLAALSL